MQVYMRVSTNTPIYPPFRVDFDIEPVIIYSNVIILLAALVYNSVCLPYFVPTLTKPPARVIQRLPEILPFSNILKFTRCRSHHIIR